MKKIVLAMVLTGMSGLIASDSGYYVGVDIGNTAADGKVSITASNSFSSVSARESLNDSGGSQTLKVGYYFNKNNRVATFYQNILVDNGDGRTFGIGYDYLIGESAFKPFIGLLAGYGSISGNDGGTLGGKSIDIAGGIFGAQVGLNYAFSENFSAELGYKYMMTNMEDTISGVYSGVTYNGKMEYDSMKNFFIGLNYKF